MSHSCIASHELSSADANTFVTEQARPGSLRLLGELDVAGVPEVWARLVGVDGDVELDCAGLTFIDASGVRLFVAVQAACRGSRCEAVDRESVSVCDPALELTGLDAVLDVRAESSAP